MSLPNSANAPQKQSTNVYTMMLILSFLFLSTAIGLLHYEVFERYSKGPDGQPLDPQPWRPVTTPLP
jgi:hypothetical protein